MTIQKILLQATEKLSQAGIDTPRLDAEVLLAHALNCRRLKLYTDAEKILSAAEVERYKNFVALRAEKIPVAYLTGNKEFFGLNFFVNKNVLIPRPDTEILTQLVIENLGGEKIFADLGTGSGAIAISVCKFVKNSVGFAVDISENALEVAKFNAKKFGVDDRINFFCGNLFEPFAGKKFDAIISNPPYIPTGDLKNLQAEVQKEPTTALDGGEDGLNFYRKIISAAPEFLFENGFLAVEVGINQADEVKKFFDENNFVEVEIFQDLAGLDRVVAGRKKICRKNVWHN